jgi:hypothetical protein
VALAKAQNAPTTPPTGWTERMDIGYSAPPTGLDVASRDSGYTGTGDAFGTTPVGNWSSLILELDTSAPGGEEGSFPTRRSMVA